MQDFVKKDHHLKMPTATTTKPAMAGVKRKSAPVKSRDVKENKKPKIDSKSTKKSKPTRKVEASSNESEDSDADADGGAPLEPAGSEDSEDSEQLPNVGDGLHPERVKAVAANSMLYLTP